MHNILNSECSVIDFSCCFGHTSKRRYTLFLSTVDTILHLGYRRKNTMVKLYSYYIYSYSHINNNIFSIIWEKKEKKSNVRQNLKKINYLHLKCLLNRKHAFKQNRRKKISCINRLICLVWPIWWSSNLLTSMNLGSDCNADLFGSRATSIDGKWGIYKCSCTFMHKVNASSNSYDTYKFTYTHRFLCSFAL